MTGLRQLRTLIFVGYQVLILLLFFFFQAFEEPEFNDEAG